MSNYYFKFKQFTVYHDKCAMKVGTDGVLLGAWAPVVDAKRILDIGTGTGLVSLMLAQRVRQAQIVGVEIDASAAEQARANVCSSPWADRIEVICCDFKNYLTEDKFDLIVSNPPYFANALKCPDEQRSMARHIGGLNYDILFFRSSKLLQTQGNISIVIPSEVEELTIDAARKYNLHLSHRTRVFTTPTKPYRRVLLTFCFQEKRCLEEHLCIEVGRHKYTPEYIALTKGFYLTQEEKQIIAGTSSGKI